MATIPPYVAEGAYPGQKQQLKIRKFYLWFIVGDGEVQTISDFEAAIAGNVDVVGYEGELNIHMKLSDQDPSATSGPCFLQMNQYTDQNASYHTSDNSLTIDAVLGGHEQTIELSRYNRNQTQCRANGRFDITAYLVPE